MVTMLKWLNCEVSTEEEMVCVTGKEKKENVAKYTRRKSLLTETCPRSHCYVWSAK